MLAPDGTFTITLDAEPDNGRRNHLQLPANAATLVVRDTLADWTRQLPNHVAVSRLGEQHPAARDGDAMIRDCADQIVRSAAITAQFVDAVWQRPANRVDPYVRDLGWGMLALNRFELRDDEALIVTIDPVSAGYVSV